MINIQKNLNNQPILSKIQEEKVWKLLERFDLNWDENYLNFHNNKFVVRILRSFQTRKKMYQGSLGDFKKYEKYSKPLIKGLESY